MSTRTRFSIAAISILALLGLAGPATAPAAVASTGAGASATPVNGAYKGKTEKGGSIKFRLAGKKVTGVNGAVPTLCLEFGGSYDTRFGLEFFRPPGAFTLGKTGEAKAVQPLAMAPGDKSTKYYTVTMRPAGNRKVKGRLKLRYSFITFGYPYYAYMWQCSSEVDFTAKKS